MNKINVELVTPEKLVLSSEADSVMIPGSEGDFGVLVNHAPMISNIRPGVVVIENDGYTQKILISGGFAEVTADRCTILATESEEVTNLDADEIAQKIAAM
jgi:F-type H+-transporting ATPase subunit epsilon